MTHRTGRLATLGAATFALAGAASIAAPSAAAAEPVIVGHCADSVQGEVGQPLELRLPLLSPINLGTVTEGTTTLTRNLPTVGGLVDSLCKVTVTAVNSAATPAKEAARPVTEPVKKAVEDLAPDVKPKPEPQNPPDDNVPAPQQPPGPTPRPQPQPETPSPGAVQPQHPPVTSPVPRGSAALAGPLLASFGTGLSPEHDVAAMQLLSNGLFSPAAGLRYGGQVPGYAPEFGAPDLAVPGQRASRTTGGGDNQPQNVGEARAMPAIDAPKPGAVDMPVLLACIALSGAAAALVRTWVLRRA